MQKFVLYIIVTVLAVLSIALIITLVIIKTENTCTKAASTNKISRGKIPSARKSHPFFASLIIRSHISTNSSIWNRRNSNKIFNKDRYLCGSAIIGNRWLLTAAHCIAFLERYGISKANWFVTSGTNTWCEDKRKQQTVVINEHTVDAYYIHEQYRSIDNANYDYDIALIKVVQPFSSGNLLTLQECHQILAFLLKYIEIIEELLQHNYRYNCSIIGFSATSKCTQSPVSFLEAARVEILNHKKCKLIYKTSFDDHRDDITDRMVCTNWLEKHRDICQFYSGGILVQGNTLIGIVSWNMDCENENYPVVHVKISKFKAWISKIIKTKKLINKSILLKYKTKNTNYIN